MAVFQNATNISNFSKFGSYSDICERCSRNEYEKQVKESHGTRVDFTLVKNSLKGKLENKPVIFTRKASVDTCMCTECVVEILLDEIKVDTIVSQETVQAMQKQFDNTLADIKKAEDKAKPKDKK